MSEEGFCSGVWGGWWAMVYLTGGEGEENREMEMG